MITIERSYIILDREGNQVSCLVRFADKLYINPCNIQKRLSRALFGDIYENGEIDFRAVVGFQKTFLLPYIKMFLKDGTVITFNIFQKRELIDLVTKYREEMYASTGEQATPLFIK